MNDGGGVKLVSWKMGVVAIGLIHKKKGYLVVLIEKVWEGWEIEWYSQYSQPHRVGDGMGGKWSGAHGGGDGMGSKWDG